MPDTIALAYVLVLAVFLGGSLWTEFNRPE